MKNKINLLTTKLGIGLLFVITFFGCTENFDEINTNPSNPESASIEGIMAGVQYFTFAEPRFITWRGNLLNSSIFAHQLSYRIPGSWWAAKDPYLNNIDWSNAVFDSSYGKVSLNVRNLLINYQNLEDKNGEAVANIVMSWFYQKMTDIYGDVPYSDVIVNQLLPDNNQPTYDPQKEIYRSIINNLNEQIAIIGDSSELENGADGDFLYKGDLQKWKAFANTLILRMAIRSRNAFNRDGESSYIDDIITKSLANTLIDETNQALFFRSETPLEAAFLDGGFEDVYYGFGDGSNFAVSNRIVNFFKENNDPRLPEVAVPNSDGEFIGAKVMERELGDQEVSLPSPKIIGTSLTDVKNQVPIQTLSAAESYFLQAEAAVLGYGGNTNDLYRQGIEASMNYWGVESSNISTFLDDEDIASLTESMEDNLKAIWNQRWAAGLTNGYESWALVRRTDLIETFTNNEIYFVTAPNNGRVPRRLTYSTVEAISNAESLNEAIKRQGLNTTTTNIWWDVD